jgi:hypothetical protein
MTSIPSIVKVSQPSKGKCGWNDKGSLLFPYFRIGCCGVDGAVVSTRYFLEVEALDVKFWASVGRAIQSQPYLDWDWYSLQQNVIKPNEAHIRAVCNIPNDKVWERFAEDGMVFLNRWDKKAEDSDADEDDEPLILPCGANCFKDVDVEY